MDYPLRLLLAVELEPDIDQLLPVGLSRAARPFVPGAGGLRFGGPEAGPVGLPEPRLPGM